MCGDVVFVMYAADDGSERGSFFVCLRKTIGSRNGFPWEVLCPFTLLLYWDGYDLDDKRMIMCLVIKRWCQINNLDPLVTLTLSPGC